MPRRLSFVLVLAGCLLFAAVFFAWAETTPSANTDLIVIGCNVESGGADPAVEMIRFIQAMRAYAAARRPSFLIIQQNAAALADGHTELFDVINAIAQEAIWYDGDATDKWDVPDVRDHVNEQSLTGYYLTHLAPYVDAGLPVFAGEPLTLAIPPERLSIMA